MKRVLPILLASLCLLAACGKKGDLTPPSQIPAQQKPVTDEKDI